MRTYIKGMWILKPFELIMFISENTFTEGFLNDITLYSCQIVLCNMGMWT